MAFYSDLSEHINSSYPMCLYKLVTYISAYDHNLHIYHSLALHLQAHVCSSSCKQVAVFTHGGEFE